MNYTVWVGGIDDTTTGDLDEALRVLGLWLADGYDDARIEIVDNGLTTGV